MKRTTSPASARPLSRRLALALALGLTVVLAACSKDETPTITAVASPRVVVTSVAGDPQSELLSAIYARVLEQAGFRVARKDPVALDRAGYFKALQDGQIGLITDLSGDFLSFLYSQPGAPPPPTTVVPAEPATTQAPITLPTTTTVAPPDTTGDTTSDTTASSTSTTATSTTTAPTTTVPADTTTTTVAPVSNGRSVTEQIVAITAALPASISVSSGAQAEDQQVIACTAAAMTANAANRLTTLTDLASVAPNIVLGGSAAFIADEETGLPALTLFYGGEFKDVVTVDDAGLAGAITDGTADCFAINSLNPLITTEAMTILVDDKVMVPSQAVIALVAGGVGTPDMIAAIDSVSTQLTTARLNQMLNEMATNGTAADVVAKAFVNTL